jgi:acetylglutamate kinase
MNAGPDKAIVVKIGGAMLGSHDTALQDIVDLQKQGRSLVVVHGGGKVTTEWLAKHGIEARFVRGERVTDAATLEVATAVLAGLTNKEIAAAINNLGGRAMGISGVDGGLIQSRIKDSALGYVGEVTEVNTSLLEMLLGAGYIPVISPISLHTAAKTDEVQMLNINADIVAGEIATAIGASRLIFLTDVAGVCDQSGKLLPGLSSGEAEALVNSGVASGGMIPKIRAGLRALAVTARTSIIDGREPHALLHEIEGQGSGTIIYR